MVVLKRNVAYAINIKSNADIFWDFANISMDIAKLLVARLRVANTKEEA